MILWIVAYAISAFAFSFLIARGQECLDRGKVATLVSLIGWSSLLFGLYLGS